MRLTLAMILIPVCCSAASYWLLRQALSRVVDQANTQLLRLTRNDQILADELRDVRARVVGMSTRPTIVRSQDPTDRSH